jgi:hypothetical protein
MKQWWMSFIMVPQMDTLKWSLQLTKYVMKGQSIVQYPKWMDITPKNVKCFLHRWRKCWHTQQFKLQSIFRTLIIFLWICKRNRGLNYTIITSIVTFSGAWFHLVESLLGYCPRMNFFKQRISTIQRLLKQNKNDFKSSSSRLFVQETPDFVSCFLETLL